MFDAVRASSSLLNYDKAMRDLGWLVVTGVHDTKDAQGYPVEVHIEDVQVKGPDGHKMSVSLYARQGAPGIREMTETGEMVFLPIERLL